MAISGSILLVPITVLMLATSPNLAAKALSVCQAFDRISLLNGKKVSVRGIWITNIEHNGIFPYKCSSRQNLPTGRLVGIQLVVSKTNPNLAAAGKRQDEVLGAEDDVRQVAIFHGTIYQTSGTGHLNQYTVEMDVEKITSMKRVKYRPPE